MSRVEIKKTIKAPAGRVWEVLKEFGGLERFIPAVIKTVLRGEGVGMTRVCTMANGKEVVERLEALDEGKCFLRYSVLETESPISGYVGDMTVREVPGGAEIEWVSSFESPEESRTESEKQVAGLQKMTLRGLERLCR